MWLAAAERWDQFSVEIWGWGLKDSAESIYLERGQRGGCGNGASHAVLSQILKSQK